MRSNKEWVSHKFEAFMHNEECEGIGDLLFCVTLRIGIGCVQIAILWVAFLVALAYLRAM